MATETALELDTEAAGTTGEAVHLPGFPGVWAPGRPIAVSELGVGDEKATLALVDELGLPLQVVKVDRGSAPHAARPNHLVSEDAQETLEQALDEATPRTHDEVNQLADAAGVQFPDDVKTVADKVAYLEQARSQGQPDAAVEA